MGYQHGSNQVKEKQMALETDLAGSVEETQRIVTPTTKVRIRGVWFTYENEAAVVEVAFGNLVNAEFTELVSELWVLTGSSFVNAMKAAPVGTTSVNVIRNLLVQMLTAIQGSPSAKQNLLDKGHLVIIPGAFHSLLPLTIIEHIIKDAI